MHFLIRLLTVRLSYERQQRWSLLLIVATATLINVGVYWHNHYPWCVADCAAMQMLIISGTISSPFAYRILVPILIQPFIPKPEDTLWVYTGLYALLIPVFYIVLYRWLRLWVSVPRALVGLVITAALMAVMTERWQLAAYTLVEAILLCVALTYFCSPRSQSSPR